MDVNLKALQADRNHPGSNEIAATYLYPFLMKIKEMGRVSAAELYAQGDVYDIPMYLALHTLVKTGLVDGVSPYAVDMDGEFLCKSHSEMVFTASA